MTKEDIKTILEETLVRSTLHVDRIDIDVKDDDGSVWYVIRSNDSKFFIGRNGETLEALNHLLRRIVENKNLTSPLPFNIIVDVNDYQKKKTENIKQIAHMMAERARFYKASVSVDPMNSFERRIIHTFLENYKDLKTESEGIGMERHVVIKYIGGDSLGLAGI